MTLPGGRLAGAVTWRVGARPEVGRLARAILVLLLVAAGVVGPRPAPVAAATLGPARTYRVGVLAVEGRFDALRDRLGEIGYVQGRNLVLEMRATRGRSDLADRFAADLARLPVDVIVATNPQNVLAARRATTTVPIVMVHTPDPVEQGLVASLAHPGGNITGTTSLSVALTVKQLELLKEAVPRTSRVAVLAISVNPWHRVAVKGLREGGRSLGVSLQILEVPGPAEFERAFQAMVGERAQAVLALADPTTFAHRRRLADLAARHRLPLMGSLREFAEAGALMSYWADGNELVRRTASYVDRILRGARPGDLPIEQPTRYELVVNLRTARALGLTIVPSLLLRATVLE